MRTEEWRRDDLLYKAIGRIDHYIGTMNAKAALVAAFNTFVIGALVLGWTDIVTAFDGFPRAAKGAGILLSLAAVSAVISLGSAFVAVKPYIGSPKAPNKYHSLLFFEHIAEHRTGEEYHEALLRASPESITSDLALQAHALAIGLRSKSKAMTVSVIVLVFGCIVPAFFILVLKLFLEVFA